MKSFQGWSTNPHVLALMDKGIDHGRGLWNQEWGNWGPTGLEEPDMQTRLLLKLIFSPDDSSKQYSESFREAMECGVGMESRMVSSTNWKELSPWGRILLSGDAIKPDEVVRSIIQAKVSTTILNRSGEIGSPCLRPLKWANKFPFKLLTKMEDEEVNMVNLIQLMNFCGKPRYLRAVRRTAKKWCQKP